ncbi:hypothetical protein COT97_01735 [Candidatus Falkowbacteria bacterium CG10_big_fil_rev_8_21_14_0_10_39_11]|uniref:Uncharacterized protein n=1 Tax=Candidatus Falkowbacteria bacterium CG10_big_fil_rev_8_21_14_0_10_39_11 TaxID=1974565 RepID=A0A2H0V5L5_9BACT|nr:MAG: hypothetical protein COT97_01735 [Candidatus Falkowbacteria bacterium CG10_big_fil_rev_8_21_14_0_10_39_11]
MEWHELVHEYSWRHGRVEFIEETGIYRGDICNIVVGEDGMVDVFVERLYELEHVGGKDVWQETEYRNWRIFGFNYNLTVLNHEGDKVTFDVFLYGEVTWYKKIG